MCERRRPPEAVERRDKHVEGRTEGAPVVRPDRRGDGGRMYIVADPLLLYADSVRGGGEK